jgi:hypothetical protein
MANAWFRMYHEFATDPKVQMLSEADQRRFIMILCLRCCNDDVTLQDEEVAFQLRISNEEWMKTKGVLLSKEMIGEDNKPTAWDKRQFISDSSRERVARHREKLKRSCNVTETKSNVLDTDTDTDTDTEKSIVADAPPSPEFLEAKKVADYLASKIVAHNPSASVKPNNWISDIEKSIRLDKKTTADLMATIDWMYMGDMFWAGVVLSGKKLREKYDQMYLQRVAKSGQHNRSTVTHMPKLKRI